MLLMMEPSIGTHFQAFAATIQTAMFAMDPLVEAQATRQHSSNR